MHIVEVSAVARRLIGMGRLVLGTALEGPFGEVVIELLAQALGVEAKPEAILAALMRNHIEVVQKLKEVETTYAALVTAANAQASQDESDDLLWGAAAIAVFLFGDPDKRRKVYHLHQQGRIGTFNVGPQICGRKSILRKCLSPKVA